MGRSNVVIGSHPDRRRPANTLLVLALVGLVLTTPRAMGQAGPAHEGGDLSAIKAERGAADELRDNGAPVEAIARYQEIWQALEARDDRGAVKLRASIASRAGNAHRMLGELDQTETWWDRALLDYQRTDALTSTAMVLGNLGTLLAERGNSAQAAQVLGEAVEIQLALNRPTRAALALFQRSALWFLTGDLGLALEDAYRAADLLTEHGDVAPGGTDQELFLLCRHRVASLLQALGADEVATQELRALAEFSDAFAPAERVNFLFSLAGAEEQAGNRDEAWWALEQARTLVEEGSLLRLLPELLVHEGWLSTASGDTELACPTLEDAVELATRQGLGTWQLRGLLYLAECRLAAGDPDTSLAVAGEALAAAVSAQSRLEWQVWEVTGRAHAAVQQWPQAVSAFEEALELKAGLARDLELDALEVSYTSAVAPRLHDQAVDAMLQLGQEGHDLERALDALEAGRSRMLLASILGADVPAPVELAGPEPSQPPPSSLGQTRRGASHLQRLRSIQRGQGDPLPQGAADPQVTSVDAVALLSTAHRARHARMIGVQTLSVDTIRQRLPRNMGVVLYRSGASGTDLFWVSRERLEHHRIETPALELRGEVDALIGLLIASAEQPQLRARLDAESQALGDRLLGPVLERVRSVRHLVVVPDGELYRLPWAALRPGGRYLVEETSVGLAPSLNILDALLERQADSRRRFVAVADPAGDLPRAAEESRYAADLFEDSVVLEGAEATWEQLSGVMHSADVLHFATHGELSVGGTPSHLALAGGQPALDVQTILGLKLETSLVTLSACRSARGTERGGEALVNSLARAFLAAGAETVLGSLWDVHDGSTSELMNRFYEEIAAGSFAVDALADAQTGLARSEGPWSHPWYWAGFVSVGDTR